MKTYIKYTPVALAVMAICASPLAMADGDGFDGYLYLDGKLTARADLALSTSKYNNDTDVRIKKEINITRDVTISGDPEVIGTIDVRASSAALTSQSQSGNHNETMNDIVNNDASAGDDALDGASGNIGLNITAGDNNFQDNSAALTAIDAVFVFGDAESISYQNSEMNNTYNMGTANNASLSGNALSGASGNIGVNVSAGNSNMQANSLVASVNSSGSMAEANVSSVQVSDHNMTDNQGVTRVLQDTTDVSLGGRLNGQARGSYSGQSDQIGDVYPDVWTGDTHNGANNSPDGHFDLDTDTQGGSDLNDDGGALAFNENGTINLGRVTLGGTFSGTVVTNRTVFRPHTNDASLSGSTLSGASGNIGVNVAAGTNNLQGNHLAIAAALGGSTPGGGE
jgi:hypothetical protein